MSDKTEREAWRVAFDERHEFDIYPEHFMSGLRNEFAAGWHAALKGRARALLASKPAVPNSTPDIEAAMKASLGQKYCPPTGMPRYDWLSPTSADRADLEAEEVPAAPAQPCGEDARAAEQPAGDVGAALIERLRKTMTRLGVFPGEGLEWFAANLESNLYSLDRAVNSMLDKVASENTIGEDAAAGAIVTIPVYEDMLRALEHVESVYRLNVVRDDEPSSTLANLQRVIARAHAANGAMGEREAFEAWYEREKLQYWLMCADKEMCFGIWQARALFAQSSDAVEEAIGYADRLTIEGFANPQNGNKTRHVSLRSADVAYDSDVALYTHPASEPKALTEALREAIDLRVKLYCNGCDDCEGGCQGKPLERDPYAKKWSALLAAQPVSGGKSC